MTSDAADRAALTAALDRYFTESDLPAAELADAILAAIRSELAAHEQAHHGTGGAKVDLIALTQTLIELVPKCDYSHSSIARSLARSLGLAHTWHPAADPPAVEHKFHDCSHPGCRVVGGVGYQTSKVPDVWVWWCFEHDPGWVRCDEHGTWQAKNAPCPDCGASDPKAGDKTSRVQPTTDRVRLPEAPAGGPSLSPAGSSQEPALSSAPDREAPKPPERITIDFRPSGTIDVWSHASDECRDAIPVDYVIASALTEALGVLREIVESFPGKTHSDAIRRAQALLARHGVGR